MEFGTRVARSFNDSRAELYAEVCCAVVVSDDVRFLASKGFEPQVRPYVHRRVVLFGSVTGGVG